MESGYSVVANLLGTALFFYMPAIYVLVPRKGNRYINFIAIASLYNIWVYVSRYVIVLPAVQYHLVIGCCLDWILLKVLFRDNLKRRLLLFLYIDLLGIVTDAVTVFALEFVLPTMRELYVRAETGEQANLIHLMAFLGAEIVCMVTTLGYLCLIRNKQWKLFFAFLLLPAYQGILMLGFVILCYDFTEGVARIGLFIGIFCFVLDGLMLQLLDHILKKQDLEEQVETLEEMRRREYAYYEAAGREAEQMRLWRHDFSNQLQAVYGMVREGDGVDMADRLLEKMRRRVQKQDQNGEK